MNRRLIVLPMAALLILGGLVGCSSEGKGTEPLMPSSTQQQGVDMAPPPSEEEVGTESDTSPMTGDGMDSGSDESNTDPTMSHDMKTDGSETETPGEQETMNSLEETEGTDPSTGTPGP